MISNKPIWNLNPHYTDPHYKTARTVWIADGYKTGNGETVKGAVYNYSDRIWQWNWNKADAAHDAVNRAKFELHSPAFIQEWLRNYFDNPKLELVHIMAGVNVGNGYAYQVFGYITQLQPAPATDAAEGAE